MTKLTTHRFKIPAVIAMAVAMVGAAQTTQAAVDPQITGDAAQAANTADLENVGAVALIYGNKMAQGEIKLSAANIKALGSVLAAAIQAKPETILVNNLTNKADEIGEAVAVVAARVATSTGFKKPATSLMLKLLNGAMQTAKNNVAMISSSSPNLFQDIAGSVILTLVRSGSTDAKLDKKVYKYLKTNASKVAGGKNKKAVILGLKEGFLNDAIANAKYEDGTLGPIIDPETDTRNG